MKAGKLYRRWAKQGLRLGRQVRELAEACAAEGTAARIHDLRVALRRFRFWARVGKPWLPKGARKALEAWGRDVARRTGPVRDLDVAGDWLRTQRPGEKTLAAWEQRRAKEWRAQQAGWNPLPPAVFAALEPPRFSRETARRLRRRVRRMEQRFEDQLADTLGCFCQLTPEARHRVRRVVRRWRYLREMLETRRERREDPLLSALLALQGAVGRTQNLDLALKLAGELVPEGALRKRLRKRGKADRKALRQETRQALRQLQKALD